MEQAKTLIGKDVIESLTLGMYEDSRFIYREYIQNAADQIDKAVREKLISQEEGTIHIEIKSSNKTISVEDNATGIPQSKVIEILKNIAQSTKERGIDKGFRGIGRLGGLGYCDTLIFETSYKGEPSKSTLTWNAKYLKEIINNRIVKEQAADVIDLVTSYKKDKEESSAHYFRVTLINVSNEALLDKKDIEAYLSMVAPVPYHNGFILKKKIYDQLKKENLSIDEYKIFVNTNQVFKNYTTTIYSSNQKGERLRTGDEIFDIHFFREHTQNGDILYWGWYGVSQFEGVIDDINVGKGIRLRKGNIQVGNKHTLLKLFRDTQRGNYYFFGEVHAFSPDLIPNARRDYFLENSNCHLFETKLKSLFHTELHQLYYDASKIRNANKRILEVKVIQEESARKEFVNSKERDDFKKQFEQKKQEAAKAKRDLEKISAKFTDKDSAVRKIYERVVDTEKINPDKIELKSNGKATYRVDKLTGLSKEQRKFLSKIFEIITANCDKKTSESLIIKIEEELK